MIDLHLIGYTPDLRHIVFEFQHDQGCGRYRLEIDADLFLTLDEVRERRRAAGIEVGAPARVVPEVDESESSEARGGGGVPRLAMEGREAEEADEPSLDKEIAEATSGPVGAERRAAPAPEPTELPAPDARPESNGQCDAGAIDTPQPESRLTPAEIQALLRAGRSLKTVAKLAGIDVCRVERWLTPILAERAQVIQEAHATPVGSAGVHSRWPLVAAVTHNLSIGGTDPGLVSWSANRRVDGRWTVQLRYRDDDRTRSASWSFDRRGRTLTAGSELAHELGWIDDPGDHEEDTHAPPGWNGAGTRVDRRLASGEGQGADTASFV